MHPTENTVTETKTEAGVRTVPLGPGVVDLLLSLKREDAAEEEFVFASKKGGRPVSYWNFRRRGFKTALEVAGLTSRGITIHATYAARRPRSTLPRGSPRLRSRRYSGIGTPT